MKLVPIKAEDLKPGMTIHRHRGDKNHSFVARIIKILDNGYNAQIEILERLDMPDSDNRSLPNIGAISEYCMKIDGEHRKDKIALFTYINEDEPTHMQDMLSYVKNKDLNAEDKALVETGLEQPSGEPTELGKQVMNAMLWKSKRSEIAKLAIEMQATKEEKKA